VPDAGFVLARVLALVTLLLCALPAAADATPRHGWRAGFETGDLSEWSFSGQGQKSVWGHLAVLDPLLSGVPRLDGRRAARFETTPLDVATGRIHAKVFRWWDRPRGGSWNVSGRYCASYFFPRTYHARSQSADMVFEFKQEWVDRAGFHQDPTWWVEIDTAREWGLAASRPDAPVAVLYHLNPGGPSTPRVVPLGRWVRVCATIRPGRSVAVDLDGVRLGTGSQRQYPVGPSRRDRRWIFGVGNYSRSANGPLWIDDASFSPRP